MRAIAIDQYGGPEVLTLRDLDPPPLGPDVVHVRARAVGVNPVDSKIREGGLDARYPCHFPLVPGWDVAGVVEAVGPDVTELSPGDEVAGYVRRDHIQWGTYAELVAAPIRTLTLKPPGVGWREAAALPLAGLTASQALSRGLGGLRDDDVVLVHAAGGGVGGFAVQLARLAGARVIGTGSEATHEHLRALGAEPVVYGPGLVEAVRALAPAGVTAVVDLVGGETLGLTPQLLAAGGRVVSVRDPEQVRQLGGRYVFVRPHAMELRELLRLVAAGYLKVHIQESFPLERAADAHRLIEGGHVHGKLVLEVG
ncbi:MAG: NADP-dependent oxidoreductase [Actinobacteria bacterium]|nr:NADP-dependent oxidoreductase [Actinomycetota bacterium]